MLNLRFGDYPGLDQSILQSPGKHNFSFLIIHRRLIERVPSSKLGLPRSFRTKT
jgi:hypothetical protein